MLHQAITQFVLTGNAMQNNIQAINAKQAMYHNRKAIVMPGYFFNISNGRYIRAFHQFDKLSPDAFNSFRGELIDIAQIMKQAALHLTCLIAVVLADAEIRLPTLCLPT